MKDSFFRYGGYTSMMNWKILIPLMILILAVGFLHFYHDIIIEQVEGEIISLLENNLAVDIEYSSFDIWPLNRIILKDFTIKKRGKQLLSSTELKIYYNTREIIKSFPDLNPDKWLQSLNYVEIERPGLDLNLAEEIIREKGKETGGGDILSRLSQLQVVLNQGKMVYDNGTNNFIINNNTSTIDLGEKGFKLKSVSNLNVKNINLDEYNLDRYNLSNGRIEGLSLEDINIELDYQNNNWQASLKTGYFSFNKLNNLFEVHQDRLSPDKLSLAGLEGQGSLAINLKGENLELKQYAGRLNFRDSQALISYDNHLQQEKINEIKGSLEFNSHNTRINFDQFDFKMAGTPFSAKGYFNYGTGSQKVFLNLKSYDFKVGNTLKTWNSRDNLDLVGTGNLEMNLRGSLDNPQISLDFYLPHGELEGELISHLKTHLRYRQGVLYLDFVNLRLNQDNQLTVEGIVNNKEQGQYNLQVEGDNIAFSLLDKTISKIGLRSDNKLDNIYDERLENVIDKSQGNLSFTFTVSGTDFSPKKMNILGDISLESPRFENLASEIWFTDQKLLLTNGLLIPEKGEVNFSGELDLKNQVVDLSLTGKNVDLNELQTETTNFVNNELPNIEGTANFRAQISQELSDPLVSSEISITRGSLAGYSFSNINMDLFYQNETINIEELKFTDQNTVVKGEGDIDLSNRSPAVLASLTLADLSCSYIEQKSGSSLPLSGNLAGDIRVEGTLQNPRLTGTLFSNNMSIEPINGYKPDKMELDFTWEKGNPVLINNLMAKTSDSRLKASGRIQGRKINLGFKAKGVDLATLNLNQGLNGSLNLEGMVEGSIDQPEVRGTINLKQIDYRQKALDKLKGGFTFKENVLALNDMVWELADSKYKIGGQVFKVMTDPMLDLKLSTEDGNINKLLNLTNNDDIPLNIDYRLKGTTLVSGPLEKPVIELDLSAYDKQPSDSKINIRGKITDKFDLAISGEEVKLNKMFALVESDQNLNLSGQTDFYGLVRGPIDDYNIDFENEIYQANVNGIPVNRVKGNFQVKDLSNIKLSQTLLLGENGKLTVNGNLHPGKNELDLSIISDKLPLNLFKDTVSMVSDVKGQIKGEVRVNGKMSQPNLNGQLQLAGENLVSSLPEELKTFSGNLLFENKQIKVSGFKGKYGQGNLKLEGLIYLFASENTWDLTLKGKDLLFKHGSYNGLFDTDGVQITGPLTEPLLEGDLKPHDFIVKMPFNWPMSENEAIFKPDLNLTLYPGENVYFRQKENIDVAIQQGSLTLLLDDGDFQMEGNLQTHQGVFDYYNNKFIIESGTADFRKFQGLIPSLHISARTFVDGVRINVNLDGPANNMITTFTSSPEMSEKEIIQLLTQKGGIGEVLKGDQSGNSLLVNFIKKEFMRLLHNTLQIDLVSNLERDLKGALQLDRMEINTYEMGTNDEITVRLGKNLSDNLYLEYTGNVKSGDVDHEWSFNYLLTDHTRIEGSWMEEDNYRLGIDTTIDF